MVASVGGALRWPCDRHFGLLPRSAKSVEGGGGLARWPHDTGPPVVRLGPTPPAAWPTRRGPGRPGRGLRLGALARHGAGHREDGFNHLLHLRLAWVNGSFETLFQVQLQPSPNK